MFVKSFNLLSPKTNLKEAVLLTWKDINHLGSKAKFPYKRPRKTKPQAETELALEANLENLFDMHWKITMSIAFKINNSKPWIIKIFFNPIWYLNILSKPYQLNIASKQVWSWLKEILKRKTKINVIYKILSKQYFVTNMNTNW